MIQRMIAILLIAFFCALSLAECGGLIDTDRGKTSSVSESGSSEDSDPAEDYDSEDSESSADSDGILADGVNYYSEDGELLCGIGLTAEETQYFVGDEGILTITISLPEYVLENVDTDEVRLENETGAQIGTYAVSDFTEDENGYYSSVHSFEFDTDTNMTFGLKTFCGEYYSPWLVITVTPEITADQIADCAVIGAELNEAMAEDYEEVSAQERAEAAKEWLEEDERILETYLADDDVIVYYVTTDYVSGAFNAAGIQESDDPLKDYSGIDDGSSWDLLDSGLLSDLYNEYGTNQIEKNNELFYRATYDSAVATNPNALLLIPCPDDMGTNREGYIRSLTEDFEIYTEASGGQATILTGTDAVDAIFHYSLNDYGLVTLFTHGHTVLLHEDKTLYLMYRSEPLTNKTKDELDSIHEDAKSKLNEFADLAYNADQKEKTRKKFFSAWYGDANAGINGLWEPSWSNRMSLTTSYSKDTPVYEIWMGSGFISSWYQNQYFDNTVFYFANCRGLLDTEFDEWLLNRGCRYLFGFTVDVNTISNVNYHRRMILGMAEAIDSHPNYFRTVQESEDNIGIIDPADWDLDSEDVDPPVWFGQIGPLSSASEQDVPSGQNDNTLYYVGENDFIFKGHGELKGHVKWLAQDADVYNVDNDLVPGATVTAYILKNRTFTEFEGNTVTTDENGEFVIPECPMGYLILVAEKDGIRSESYQIYFVDDEHDGGDLFLPKPQGLVRSANLGAYKGKIYKLRGEVGDLESLPVSAAKYDYISSFAFYNRKVYYCCKESGTSDYYMALYEANPDGSGQRELYAPSEMNLALNHFAIKDGLLYYYDVHWSGSNRVYDYYQIDLKDGSITAAPNPPGDVVKALSETSGYYVFDDGSFYTAGGSLPGMPLQIVWEKEDGTTETLVTGEVSVRLEGVFPTAIPGDYDLYYSTFTDGGQTAALYRMNVSTRETVELDSHIAAGGGIYFNW